MKKADHISKKKALRLISALLCTLMLLLTLASCGKSEDFAGGDRHFQTVAPSLDGGSNGEGGDKPPTDSVSPNDTVFDDGTGNTVIKENPFVKTSEQPISTFSADVDTASYTYFRKLVNSGYGLEELKNEAGSIRTEEMVNYFDYDYAPPAEGELFGHTVTFAPAPWNGNSVLMILGLQAAEIETEQKNNLVFLIDVSGSMMSKDKLPLLKSSFTYLVEQLGENDIISIVTYSGKEEVVLDSCEGTQKQRILNAINSLEASGSTNGQAGLQKAYELAERNFIEDGNNRIIMASDGDLNVGITSEDELKSYISEKKDKGVFLSVLGFGTGNFKDAKMSAIAQNGNGVYHYIDSEAEAERIFTDKLLSTLYTS